MPPSCALLGGFTIGARLHCYGNTMEMRGRAHRTQCHALCMPAKTRLASHKIDTPVACAIPFRPYCGGVVTRTRNVSEYMLVLALCLVELVKR